jgi:hypothetical protein
MRYEIFCIIPGGNPAFSVKIDETETVGHLKKEIKAQNGQTLATVDAVALTLYRIEVDGSNEELYIEEVKRLAQDLSILPKLQVVDKLAEVFASSAPNRQKIHILVKPPKGVIGVCVCVGSTHASIDHSC